MILLIRDNCPYCVEFEGIQEKIPQMLVFKVIDGRVDIGDGILRPIDKKIVSLPALLIDNAVYMKIDGIREKINSLENSLGEKHERS